MTIDESLAVADEYKGQPPATEALVTLAAEVRRLRESESLAVYVAASYVQKLTDLHNGVRRILNSRLPQGREHEKLPWQERMAAWAACAVDDLEALLAVVDAATDPQKGGE